MKDILQEIIEYKRKFIIEAKHKTSCDYLKSIAKDVPASRGFTKSLKDISQQGKPALIAEIKKASPSKGIIRHDFNPVEIAKAYENGGAACLSVLTDEKYFQGSNQYLQQARQNCNLPVLRKDFIIDEYQIIEAKVIGADCILLIMAALDIYKAIELEQIAQQYKIDILIEVHNKSELELALKHLSTPLIGINNRNLKTMQVNLQTSINLSKIVPDDKIIICESGIKTNDDVRLMQNHGINCFLVGESLMLQDNITQATINLL